MNVVTSFWTRWTPLFQSVLRFVAAALFIMHGTTKLFAWPASVLPSGGVMALNTWPGVGGLLETVLGPFLLVGLFTRPVAFLLCGEMAVAYFRTHAPRGVLPIFNGGEVAVLFCFVCLYFSAAGAGPLSLDALRGKQGRV